MKNILEVKNLHTHFSTQGGTVAAVRGVSLTLAHGEIIGIVGESGSGKSVTMLSVMGLLAQNGQVTEGEVLFEGEDISAAKCKTKAERRAHEKRMQVIRCKEISMIFQDPMTYLNPVLRIETQMVEAIRHHQKLDRKQAREKAVELMSLVGIPDAARRLRQYPHEFSGGMRQRIIIAIALSCNPKIIIADEPTTALDVTIQAQVLELIRTLTQMSNVSTIMITHDLGIVASMCDRILIMYGGKVVEQGTDCEIFYNPKHPYTKGLLGSINNPEADEHQKLVSIPGSPPDLLAPPAGCPFVDRCEEAMRVCKLYPPEQSEFSQTHLCSCWLHHSLNKEVNACD